MIAEASLDEKLVRISSAQPLRAALTRRDEVQRATLALIDAARRTIRCQHHDLAVFQLTSRANTEALQRFLHGHPSARIRLLVDDASWLERDAPRLRMLQRRFSHALELRVASGEDPVGHSAALLIDEVHSLVLEQTAHGIGELWFANPPRLQPLLRAFDRRWEAAGHNLPVSPLGL
jgi:hypothetical protein